MSLSAEEKWIGLASEGCRVWVLCSSSFAGCSMVPALCTAAQARHTRAHGHRSVLCSWARLLMEAAVVQAPGQGTLIGTGGCARKGGSR